MIHNDIAFSRRARFPASVGQAGVWFLVVALVAGPLFPLLYASLRSKAIYLPGGVFTLDGYRTLFADPAYWTAVRNTVIFAIATTLLAVVGGTALAIACNRTNLPGRRAYGLLLMAPIVIPPMGLIVGWLAVYGQGGYLTQVVSKNLRLPAWNLSSVAGMAVLGAVVTLPIAYLTTRSALAGSDSSLEDAARSAGAGPLRVIGRITLPMLRPAILDCTVLIFALCLEILGLPLFVGAPANIDFYASYLYRSWNNSLTPDPPFVSAGAVLLLLAVSLLLIVRARLSRAAQRFIVAGPRGGSGYRPLDLGRWRWPASIGLGAFIGVTSVIPLLGLILMSCVSVLTTLVAPWHLFTSYNWHTVATDVTLRRSVLDSLLIGVAGGAATVLLVAIATLIAHRSGFPLRRAVPAALMYPRSVPGVILGIGFFWTYLMFTPGALVRNNLWGEAIALCVRNLTLAYVVIQPSLARINAEFDKAARSSGAGWWTIARRILLPILRPALLAAFVLMFITLLSDYDPVVFLQKPGTEVLGVTMLQYWAKGIVGPVAALAVLQVVIVGVVVLIGARLLRRCAVPEIRIEGLAKSFGGQRVLNGVTFTVRDKEFVTLLGPSGCGKTTTLMCIAGFLTPDDGLIACGDETFTDPSTKTDLPAERRSLGMVFQSYALWPHMTVAQNVAFPLRLRKMNRRESRDRVAEVLALVELAEYGGRYPHQLSGGQQQRVALARALAYSPKVLLLDEPFSSLDAKLRERARDWLKQLQHSLGLTTVFVTHDQVEALSMSDRILVMNDGRVLREGAPEEVYREPGTRFAAEFLGQCNFLTGEVITAADGTPVLVTPEFPQPIVLRGRLAEPGTAATVAVRPEDVEVGADGGASPAAEGTVLDVSYLGDHYRYLVAVGGTRLIVHSRRRLEHRPVRLSIPSGAATIIY